MPKDFECHQKSVVWKYQFALHVNQSWKKKFSLHCNSKKWEKFLWKLRERCNNLWTSHTNQGTHQTNLRMNKEDWRSIFLFILVHSCHPQWSFLFILLINGLYSHCSLDARSVFFLRRKSWRICKSFCWWIVSVTFSFIFWCCKIVKKKLIEGKICWNQG